MAVWLHYRDERHRLESPWCRVSKFALLNGLGGPELSRALQTFREADDDDQDLIKLVGEDMTWLVSAPNRLVRSANNAGRPFNAAHDFMLCRHTVRYCPECIRVGFHSLLFQAFGVRSCPYHGCVLMDACAKCGERMPSFDSVRKKTFAPLHCAACRTPFCDLSDFEAVFRTSEALAPVLACFDALVSRIEECIRKDTSSVGIERSPNSKTDASLLPILWALTFSSDIPEFFQPLPALCWGPLLREESGAHSRSISRITEEFRGAARLFRIGAASTRGMDAAAERSVAQIDGHVQRSAPALGYVLWDETERFVLSVRPARCACCETWVHWRATSDGLLRAIERLPRLAPSLRASALASRPDAWAEMAHAAFFRSSAVHRAVAAQWGVIEASELLCGYQRIDLEELIDSIDDTSKAFLGGQNDMLQDGMARGIFATRLDGLLIANMLKDAAESDLNRNEGKLRVVLRSVWFIETGSIASRSLHADPWVPGIEVREPPKPLGRLRQQTAAFPEAKHSDPPRYETLLP